LNPVTGAAGANTETVVVGRSIGEQRSDGSYHGHITVLAALGNEIISDDTVAGQSISGGLSSAQQGVLNNVCTTLQICLSAIVANSTTTTTSTTNHFEATNVHIGATGVPALNLSAVSSDGNIATKGNCQVAAADSNVAELDLTGSAAVSALQSTSNTTTCNSGGTSVAPTATSKVINLGAGPTGIALPPIVPTGCATGAPNTDGGIPALLPLVCNADDTNGAQTTIPYNVREALTLFVLSTGGGTGLAKVTAGASETAAAAPPSSTGTTSTSTGTTSTSTGTTSTSTGTTSTGTTSTGTTSTGTTSTGTTSTGTTSTGTTSTGTTSTGTTSTGTTSTGTTTTAHAAALPFTGYDMTAAVLLGVLLLGTGIGSRKWLVSRGREAN
jgi:mucin-2